MKHYNLRNFIKSKRLSRPFEYANKNLIIDGRCFRDLYKMSGCQFILGGEYDRFASSLKNWLNIYIKSGINCYIIFSGAGKTKMEERKQIHQKIIDKSDAIQPGGSFEYCEPIYVKELIKDVLDELKIKYYYCMYDSKPTLFSTAKKLKCPILSKNIEYALYGVSVIQLKSVKFDEKKQSVICNIYHASIIQRWCPFSYELKSIFLAVTDEDSKFYNELCDMLSCRREYYISTMMYWIRRQNKHSALQCIQNHLKAGDRQDFMDATEKNNKLFIISNSTASEYLLDGDYMGTDVCFDIRNGKIATPLINLITIGTLSGSWVVCNKNREDAMLVAVDIALYIQALLKKCREAQITFIGRKGSVCDVSLIKKFVNIPTVGIDIDHFYNFIKEHLPGLDLTTLQPVPEDSWVLLIALLYYNKKSKMNIMNVVYSVILSYVLLGAVSEKVGVIKRSNFSVTHGVAHDEGTESDKNNANTVSPPYEDCFKAASAVVDLFYVKETALKDNFDRDVLHTLSEFQYCLQFINYLNKLCGAKIKCTKYHKSLNCTFIYNVFIALNDENDPGKYIQKLLNSPPIYSVFSNILHTYFKCLTSLKY